MGPRAAVYCRISDDKAGGGAGVDRQRTDCLALVQREGWSLVGDDGADTFTDNDRSAYSGRPRPAYLRLVDGLRAGEIDVVVAWHPDRLHRSPRELEDFIDVLEAARARVVTVRAGIWDLSTPSGRMLARQLGAVARYESEHKSDRVRAAMLQRADRGAAHGALRTYGLRGQRLDDGSHTWEVVEDEAAILREAAQRVLAGEALWSVVRDFAARGVPTLRGGAWSRQTLRAMLISARVAGWREHTPGRDGRNRKGQWTGGEFTAPAEWPAILDRPTVERLRAVLGDTTAQRGTSSRSYLLSGGLLRCECGAPMSGRPRHRDGGREYRCHPQGYGGAGCGRVNISAGPVEEFVVTSVREVIEHPHLDKRLRRDAADDAAVAWARVAALEADLAALGADHGRGLITRGEWMAAREPLAARLKTARRDLERSQGAERAALLAGGIREWDRRWQAAEAAGDLERQRTLLRAVLNSVTVRRATRRGGNRFEADRVLLDDWRV